MAAAFSVVLKEIQADLDSDEPGLIDGSAGLQDLQALISRAVLLERDLSDLIDTAATMEDGLRDKPYEILDFSSEWEGF